jgi:GNAT superfamily N-acetyltransferase
MSLVIRPGIPADAPVVAEFNRLLALESEHKVLDPVILAAGVAAALADSERARYFVAEEDGQVLGQLALTREWSDWRNRWVWWLQSVYVRSDARRRGVFRALFEHVETLSRQDPDVLGLRLYVEQENTVAQETYARLGMSNAGYLVLEKLRPI